MIIISRVFWYACRFINANKMYAHVNMHTRVHTHTYIYAYITIYIYISPNYCEHIYICCVCVLTIIKKYYQDE